MLRYVLAILLSLSLLTQVGAPAWATSGPAAAAAEVEAVKPPCHGTADAAKPAAQTAAMPCCGDADQCRCLIGCGTASAPIPRIAAAPAYARAPFDRTAARPDPLPAHLQRLLRPPTFLRES